MKTSYAIVNVEDRRLGTYVPAENVAAAFAAATARYKTRHPRLDVETIAVQEIAEEVKRLGSRLNKRQFSLTLDSGVHAEELLWQSPNFRIGGRRGKN